MAIALITGTNRGLGLEICRQLAARGDTVLAACREPSAKLSALGVEVVAGVNVADDASVQRLPQALNGRPLDLLVNNAGVLSRETLDDLDLDRIRRQFEINSLGPLRVTRALLPSMQRGSKIAIVTSLMGSMGDNGSGSSYGYRMSKAAVNAAGVSLARDLEGRGISVAILHPGMVATEMTGGRGITVNESVSGLLARIDEWGPERSGEFWHARGEPLPW
jgi:NAD(P)-dependent dehydrogenase (short-subunit alcohol dehydrogenase family)